MAKFTEETAGKLSVPEGVKEVQVFDDALPGFGIRKFATGAAVYFVKFNVGKQQRRKGLGRVVKGNLAATRLAASKILIQAAAGIDTVAQTKAAGKPITTLGSLVPIYLKTRENDMREKSHTETERYLTKGWKPLHGHAVDGIGRRDIVAILDTMKPVAADRAKAALSGLYSWAIDRGYLETNPTIGIRSRGRNGGRTRVLSETELAQIWRASGDDDFGAILKLLILTGQRRTEIGSLRWSEIDLDKRLIELPPPRTKNARPHIVPLSAASLAIIASVPRGDHRDLVFGRSASGFVGWAFSKQALDVRLGAMDPWVIHDIRRSFVTLIEDNGFSLPHVTEAIINHVSGKAKAGTAGIYNKAVYLRERIQALEAWGKHIAALVTTPTTPRVIGAKPKQLKNHQTVTADL